MLLVIEGSDGAGKSTQVKMLREYLQQKCSRFEYIHFPRYDAPVYGDLIGKFLRGGFGDIDKVHPQLVGLLYALDRRDAIPDLNAVLSQGGTVLLDRYVYSNIAYQCSKVSDPVEASALRDWIFDTEYGAFGLPKPDLNIFLDVPMDFVKKSLETERGGSDRNYLDGGKDIHESSLDFQARVQSVYRAQCELDPNFVRVDCADESGAMMAPDRIFAKIKAIVDEKI